MNGFTGGFTFVRAMIAYCSQAVSKEVDARNLKQDVAEHVERHLFVTQVRSGTQSSVAKTDGRSQIMPHVDLTILVRNRKQRKLMDETYCAEPGATEEVVDHPFLTFLRPPHL